ncbi:PCDG3 protein, partial [Rhodinocichla rosea]|nr:PCDG3 protein [Rhodinocichla rosea]
MCAAGRRWGRRQRALLWAVLLAAWEAAWGQLRYSVPEEMPKGSFVGDVAKDLGLQLPELGDRGVRVLSEGRMQYFALHGKTGHLVTAERIDREQLCRLVEKCVLRCELIVEGQMQVYRIEVEIKDINDNAPSFREAEKELRMSEMTAPGSRFPLAEAHDPDSGRNSLRSYELSGDEHFSLAVQAGPGGDQRPELVLAKALDREEAAFHELMCAAGRRWGRRQRALLWTVLLAAWEAAWGQLRYSVPEEMPKGSFVGDVAKDLELHLPEIGDNAVRVVSEGSTQYFALHGKTGHLVTAERIDREQLCERVQQCVLRCELIVEGEMRFYGIEVEITDMNDNAPSFKDIELEERISETTAPGSRFPLAEAHDPDSGRNSLQSYELSGDEHFSLAVQAGPGGDQRPELVLAKALDREEAAFHELVVAVDADAGQNAWLSYELAKATEPGLFRVGLHSGEVRTARSPLARDAACHSLLVLVRDHGRPALSATATLSVVLAESVAELLAELGSAAAEAAAPGEPAASLTRWLVLAVAAVSCLFVAFLLLLLALRLRRCHRRQLLPPDSGALRGVPVSHFVGIDGVRAFLQSYSHDVSLTADSRKSQLRFSAASCCDTLPARPPPDEPAPLLGDEDSA